MAGQLLAILFIVGFGDIRITNMHGLWGVGEMNYIMSLLVTIHSPKYGVYGELSEFRFKTITALPPPKPNELEIA